MAIYKKVKNDTIYYSTKEGVPDQGKLEALTKLVGTIDDDILEASRTKLMTEAQDGDPQKSTIDMLVTITKTYETLSPMSRESMDARQTMAVTLLNEKPADLTREDLAEEDEKKRYADPLDKHISVIRKSASASWLVLRGWCDAVDEKGKKTGKYLAPPNVLKALDAKVEEVKAESERRKAQAEANKAAKAAAAA